MRRKRVIHGSLSFRSEVGAEIEGARRLFAGRLLGCGRRDDAGRYLRASPRLSSLALETSNALLPPFGSHLVG